MVKQIGFRGIRLRRSIVAAIAATAIVSALPSPALAEYLCQPGTPIPGGLSVLPFNITAPGCYWLAANRTMNGAAPAIQISASHVYLDLRGHTIRHTIPTQSIIRSTVAITDVHVTNGKLTGPQNGIGLAFAGNPNGDFNFSDLTITDDGVNPSPSIGILIGGGTPASPAHAVVARNTIDVSRVGIALDTVYGSRIEDNVLIGRGPTATVGIQLGDCQGNDVRGNTVSNMFVAGGGAGIALFGANSSFNNVQHNTVSACYDGIRVDTGRCNAIDWNVCNGNINTGITFTGAAQDNVYSFNRASGACNASGSGILDVPGTNVNGGFNF